MVLTLTTMESEYEMHCPKGG